MQNKVDGIVLFSGGLDSVLAAKLLQRLGLCIFCAHFASPFFGNPGMVPHWRSVYELDIESFDISESFCRMLAGWPPHGVGKTLNPCIDCKIILLQAAKKLLAQTGASFIATGEVLGQRPMSQRREPLNIIDKVSAARPYLLRPLSAQLLEPTDAELSGLVPREKLLRISGRGRLEQLALAKEFGIEEIPSPAGGCLLTERETARRCWPLFGQLFKWHSTQDNDQPMRAMPANSGMTGKKGNEETAELARLIADFRVCGIGRMLWRRDTDCWLLIGRNKADNDKLMQARMRGDIVLRLPVAGPLALARHGASWPPEVLREAAMVLGSYAPAGKCPPGELQISVRNGKVRHEERVFPQRLPELWNLPAWEDVHDQVKNMRKLKEEERLQTKASHARTNSTKEQP